MFAIVAIALGNIVTALGADEAFTLKQYQLKEGDRLKLTWQVTTEDTVKTTIAMRRSTEETSTKQKGSYTEELIKTSPDSDRVLRLRRTYHDMSTIGIDGEKTDNVFVGKTVEVDFSQDKTKFTIDGKPPSEEEQKESERVFVKDVDLKRARETLPEKPLKVGEEWKLDRKTALAEMKSMLPEGSVIDDEKSKFVGKLVKVEKKDGNLEGVLEFTFTMPIKKFPINDEMTLDTEPGSTITFKEIVTGRIDGSPGNCKTELSFNIVAKFKLPDSTIEMKSLVKGTELEEYLPKAKK